MPPAIPPYPSAPYNVGTYYATATFTSNDSRYGNATATATIVINPIAPTIVINGGPFSYAGTPVPAMATAINIDGVTPVPGTFSFTYNGSPTPPSLPGTYNVVAIFTVDSSIYDYTSTTASGTLTIVPATPAIVINGGPFSYTGAPQPVTATAYAIDGATPLNGSFQFTYDGSTTVPSFPGTYQVAADFTIDPASTSSNLYLATRHGHRFARRFCWTAR